ncbi:MAG: hypothetical protein Q4D56_05950 [Bacteroides sp.]|nr:hypothetical protein [Bacteroides sp.]
MKQIDEHLEGLLDWATGEEVCNYIRSGISVYEKRRVLLEVERMIKEIAGHEDRRFLFCLFSEKETSQLESLLSTRSMILDEMMAYTPEEIERFKYQNEKLLRLSEETRKQTENMIRIFFRTPHREEDMQDYDLERSLTFCYGGEDSVMCMPNDDYYGSDFHYMLNLIDTLTKRIPCDPNLINGFCSFFTNEEEALSDNAYTLDDGTTWAEGYLRCEAFDDICICHAVHVVCTHLPYSVPDLLRMDNFYINVRLEYGREVCDQLEASCKEEHRSADEEELPSEA